MNLEIEKIFLRLIIATLFGAIIGSDRMRKGRAAGTKTHAIVALGAALTVIVGIFVNGGPDAEGDVLRLSAQVISGIGFLGAGTIIVTGQNQVFGLTTAAALWFSAIIGVAAGAGVYEALFIAMICWFLIFTFIQFVDKRIQTVNKSGTVFIKYKAPMTHLDLALFLRKIGIEIHSFENLKEVKDVQKISNTIENLSNNEVESHVIISVHLPRTFELLDFEKKLKSLEGIIFAEVLADSDSKQKKNLLK